MFFDDISIRLRDYGFSPIESNNTGIYSYMAKGEQCNYVVHIVNFPDDITSNIGSLTGVLNSLNYNVVNSFERPVRCLNVYVTSEPEIIKSLCITDGNVHWLINKRNNSLLIYENQAGDFCGLRAVLEDTLSPKRKTKFIPYITYSIVAINIIIFLFMSVLCSNYVQEEIYDAGGLYWPAMIYNGQIWRLFTYMFLHANIQHVSNNMLLLFFIGAYIEEYVGRKEFTFIYFMSGILAGLVSMSYNILMNNRVLGIGASGAIYGIVGALVALLLLSKNILKDITWPRLIFFIVLSIMSGFESTGIDNMAHIGGLVFGFLISLAIILMKKHKLDRKIIRR